MSIANWHSISRDKATVETVLVLNVSTSPLAFYIPDPKYAVGKSLSLEHHNFPPHFPCSSIYGFVDVFIRLFQKQKKMKRKTEKLVNSAVVLFCKLVSWFLFSSAVSFWVWVFILFLYLLVAKKGGSLDFLWFFF